MNHVPGAETSREEIDKQSGVGKPFFSICIPAYEMHGRGGQYLEELLESLHSQTCRDFEVLVSDQAADGSIRKVCEAWEKRLPVRYLAFQEHRGKASANANNAINHATGSVIKIMDLDDFFFSREALKTIKESMETHPGTMWGACGFVHIDGDRTSYFKHQIPRFNSRILNAVNTMGNPSISFFLKDTAELLDENLKWMNDCELYYRLYEKFGAPLIIPETLIAVRIGPHQVTNQDVDGRVKEKEISYSLRKHHKSLIPYRIERLATRIVARLGSGIRNRLLRPLAILRSNIVAVLDKEDLLTRLANRHGSDKGTRKKFKSEGDRMFYTPIYNGYFEKIRMQPLKILEIGIGSGPSTKIWPKYFPHAKIYAVDIDDFSSLNTDRLTCFKGDQAERIDLKRAMDAIGGPLDIIIDDGGHYMDQQQISCGFLFKYLKPGGLYFIEDLCTSYWPYNGQSIVYSDRPIDTKADGSNTTLKMVRDSIKTGKISSEYLTEDEIQYLNDHLGRVELVDTVVNKYGPNHLAVFTKK